MIASKRSAALVFTVLILVLTAGACENTTPSADERQAIDTAVRKYLNALAESYSNLDVSPLEGLASPNEIETVEKLLKTLALSGNDRVHSELIGFDVEAMSVFRRINATVRLIEVWDVTRYDLTTGREKGHNPSSLQNTVLQLRKVKGSWIVIGRTVLDRDQHAGQPEVATPAATGDSG
jgi:hypothetical protein